MKKICTDYLFGPNGNWIKDGALILDDEGKILSVIEDGTYDKSPFEYYPGILVPGFINAHCHLELSHMKAKAPTGTGLIPFLKTVVQQRDISQEEILEAIQKADEEMYTNGIVAVGDISNKTDTIKTKENSKIQYYTFIEAFDFMQDQLADNFFNQYKEVYESYGALKKSFVPHAPYSVSSSLFHKINEMNNSNSVLSIHNQEIEDEDLLFESKGGGFPEFFGSFGFSYDAFQPMGKKSIYYAMQYLPPDNHVLFVHNTMTKKAEVESALKWNKQSFFVTCPNANLYIENRLPDYSQFMTASDKICIGTDSLTSNWQLSIFDEIKTILKYQSQIKLHEALKWATINGACALKLDKDFGSFEIGKRPGVNWVQGVQMIGGALTITEKSISKKIM